MAQKDIELILTRQLASYLATPVFIVDAIGTLVFYNEPAEVILIEGLFLDSGFASDFIAADLTLVLEAAPESIAAWRRIRDESLRAELGGRFRNWEETEQEIALTRRAYSEYQRERTRIRRIDILAGSGHDVLDVSSGIRL